MRSATEGIEEWGVEGASKMKLMGLLLPACLCRRLRVADAAVAREQDSRSSDGVAQHLRTLCIAPRTVPSLNYLLTL